MNPARTVEIKPQYILFSIKGTYLGFAQALDILKEISGLAEEHQSSKILFDITNVVKIPPVMDLYDLGEQAAKIWGHQLKIAIVTKPNEITAFFENVAVNRGAVVKVMHSIIAAETWLASD